MPILWAANMSLGINVLLALIEKTARRSIPPTRSRWWRCTTARRTTRRRAPRCRRRAAAAGRQVKLEDVWRKSRDGHTGARPAGEIGFATLRGGEEVGVHTGERFAAAGERLELSHRAFSRETYASGAVRGALWLRGKTPGLYGMKDVLGLSALSSPSTIPGVLVGRRAHRGEGGLRRAHWATLAPRVRRQEAADDDPVAARAHRPAGARPARSLSQKASSRCSSRSPSGATRNHHQLAVGQCQEVAALGVEIVAVEQPPQERHVEPAGSPAIGQAPSRYIGRPISRLARITNRISHLKPTGDRLRWGRKSGWKKVYGLSHAMNLYGPDEVCRHPRVLRPPQEGDTVAGDRTGIRQRLPAAGRRGAVGAGDRCGVNRATGPCSRRQDAAADARSRREEADRPHQDDRAVQHQGEERHRTAQEARREHGGEVPRDREALQALPGVGRKTANVVMNVAFGEATIAVDTHIFRVANRTGLAPGKNPQEVERAAEARAGGIPAACPSLADPARALHLQGAEARVPGVRR